MSVLLVAFMRTLRGGCREIMRQRESPRRSEEANWSPGITLRSGRNDGRTQPGRSVSGKIPGCRSGNGGVKRHNRVMRSMSASLSDRSVKSAAVQVGAEDDVLVFDRPVVGMPLDDVERLFDRGSGPQSAGALPRLDLSNSGGTQRRPATCVRHFLSESEGIGYWDFFKPADHFMISVAEATYQHDQWIRLEGDRFFKLRLLLAGALLDRQKRPLLHGPQALLHLSPGRSADGYFVAGGPVTKLIVLHCRTELLATTLGLDPSHVPPPLNELFEDDCGSSMQRVALGPEVFHAAQRIIDSRHGVPNALRAAYLESMGQAILCEVLSELSNHELVRQTPSRLSARDLNRIYEARDYLAQHFQSPPTIPQLARMVGVNQTKLKARFREVMGITIYDYIVQRRMERASDLLLTRNYNVAEVAYMVGYEYPANFTCAFKRHFGCLPRSWKRP